MDSKMTLLTENIARRIVGKEELIEKLVIALLAGGHVLIEDVPGVGKTTLARSLAESIEGSFARIQFTPDTLPSDVTGMSVYNAGTGEFTTVLGPVKANIVLADEINRTSPRTQSALLEAMEEQQLTIDGVSYPIPDPFMVIGTQNPSTSVGTYPLPEAQMDRFLMKLTVGYPSDEDARAMARRFLSGEFEESLKPVLSAEDIVTAEKSVREVTVSDEIVGYVSEIVKRTRKQQEVKCGASPRASLDLLRACQAKAYVSGRDYVIPEDVLAMAEAVLPHRLMITAEGRMNRVTGEEIIRRILREVKVPQ
ncbi:MAG: MoxR family ATPase [Lachnospiraceae bacterium]|nr:MoxR family ATPase [Lachnospiraceae bacterium]